MKSKQEVIQEAWLKYGIPYSPEYINENGYMIRKAFVSDIIDEVRIKIEYKNEGFTEFEFENKFGNYRPLCLKGIETNNGWTRIESEEDLPKENGTYYVMTKDGMKSLYWMNGMGKRYNVKKWMEYKPTHYLLEVVPKPPIY